MDYIYIVGIALIVWNFFVFAMYGIDKLNSKRGKPRISERSLLLLAALMGGFGAFIGMRVFRHKTQKLKFKISVPLLMFINVGIVLIYYIYF